MPRNWAEVFGYDIGWQMQYARRTAVWLVVVHGGLFAALALCWGRWPWASLVALAGVTASVSLWSALYHLRQGVRRKVAVWGLVADETPGVPPPPPQGPYRGLGRWLLHPFVLPPLFAVAWVAALVFLIVHWGSA
jgi:hypothetical protein